MNALPRHRVRCGFGLALALACAAAFAQTADDPVLPELLPVPATAAAPARTPLGLELQLGWVGYQDRVFDAGSLRTASSQAARLALDLRLERTWGGGWRLGLSDRFESVGLGRRDEGAPEHERTLNSLREAWVSRHLGSDAAPAYLDVGRINWRLGVASGYNPSDFFKSHAVRSADTLDPGAQRLQRLGTAMLRGQTLSDGGAWTVAVAPRLARRDDDDEGSLALALERTNRRAAALVKWAPRLSERATLDLQLADREGEKPQLGLNATWLANDATVLYAEWAGGRRVPLLGPDAAPAAPVWRQRAALGGTWTASNGLELTLETQYAGDALARGDWDRWRLAADAPTQIRLGALAADRAAQQEPLVRLGWFTRAAWHEPFGWRGADLAGFVQINGCDHSQLWQLKLSWRRDERVALAAQIGGRRGSAASEFGGSTNQAYASAYLSAFF